MNSVVIALLLCLNRELMFVLELHVSLDIALLFGCVRTERAAEGPHVPALVSLVLV